MNHTPPPPQILHYGTTDWLHIVHGFTSCPAPPSISCPALHRVLCHDQTQWGLENCWAGTSDQIVGRSGSYNKGHNVSCVQWNITEQGLVCTRYPQKWVWYILYTTHFNMRPRDILYSYTGISYVHVQGYHVYVLCVCERGVTSLGEMHTQNPHNYKQMRGYDVSGQIQSDHIKRIPNSLVPPLQPLPTHYHHH